jgi:hypothetical protein
VGEGGREGGTQQGCVGEGDVGFVLGRNYNLVIDTSKARKLGWSGWVLIFFFFM